MPERIEHETANPLLKQAAIQRYVFASKFLEKKIFLDIACTIGYGSDIIKNYQPTATAISGDYYFKGLQYGKEIFSKEINFCQLDALNLPFKDSKFDAIVSFETLEHFTNPELFFKEIHRILKNNGVLICSTPNRLFTEKVGIAKQNPYHEKEYTHDELKKLLKKYFKNIKSYGQSEIGTNIAYKHPIIWRVYRIIRPIIIKLSSNDPKVISVRRLNPKYRVKEFWIESPKLIFVAEKK